MYTLADAKELSQDKLAQDVVDEFRKNPLLDALEFDDTAQPDGNGTSMTYTYNRVTTYPKASGRALGTEYEDSPAKTKKITVDLKPFGGAVHLDRVITGNEERVVNIVDFQLQQKIKASTALFSDWFINGDSSVDPLSFDGLDKALTGSRTERFSKEILDMSSATKIKENWQMFLYEVQQTLKLLNGAPSIMAVNNDIFAIWQTVASYATQCTITETSLGTPIVKYGPVTIMDMGDKPGTADPIIEITKDGEKRYVTDMFFVRTGLDGVHGVTPEGQKGPKTYKPNMADSGAVKKFEVEMVAAVAIKATMAAGVLRNIIVG